MGGHRRAGAADRQTEERLARLLQPGPRHARLAADWSIAGPDAADDFPTPVGNHPVGVDPVAVDPVGVDRVGDPVDELLDVPNGDGGDPQPAVSRQTRARPEEAGRVGLFRGRLGGRFERPQLLVIAAIVIIGLLLSGWAVLRARPVAIAAPGAPSAGGQQPGHSAPAQGTPPTGRESAPARAGPAAEQSTPTTMIRVHVLGAVRRPGVVELPAGARVQDALQAARGPRKRAGLGDLNLAQPLADGQQVFVADEDSRGDRESEVRDPGSPVGGTPGGADAGSGGSPAAPGAPSAPVDLNAATLQELDDLPGVGPVTAQKILGWRDEHGRFNSVDELQEIDGIGPKTFAELAPLVTV